MTKKLAPHRKHFLGMNVNFVFYIYNFSGHKLNVAFYILFDFKSIHKIELQQISLISHRDKYMRFAQCGTPSLLSEYN